MSAVYAMIATDPDTGDERTIRVSETLYAKLRFLSAGGELAAWHEHSDEIVAHFSGACRRGFPKRRSLFDAPGASGAACAACAVCPAGESDEEDVPALLPGAK